MHVYCGSESLEYMLREISRALCNLQALYEYMLDWQENNDYQYDNNINHIKKLRPEIVQFALPLLNNLEYLVNAMKGKNSTIRNSTIIKFLLSIAKNDELRKELEILSNLIGNCDCIPDSANYNEICSQLNKVMTDLELPNLEHKICFLELLSKKIDFAIIKAGYVTFIEKDDNSSHMEFYEDVWFFYDIVHDTNFRQVFINGAINEVGKPFNEKFREDMSKYLELSQEGKNIASRHFEEKIAFQAYCEETGNANRVLNVNLINYNGSEPIKISDILQQEKDISKLDIYCDKNLEIRAYKEGKKRYYKFEDGACYQMTSTWSVEDESGNTSTCTMVMNVSSEGITEITSFSSGKGPNGGNYQLSPEKNKELIKKNEELYIQGSPLHEAVKKFLGMQQGREEMIRKGKSGSSLPDVVPKGNIGSNPTASGALEVHEEQPNLGKNNENMNCDTGNQSRYRTEVYLVPGTDTPQTYKTTLYVKIRNNSQIKENSHEDNINDTEKLSENSEFIECIGGLKGVVEGNIDSEHASCDNSPASTPPSTPAKYRTPGRQ